MIGYVANLNDKLTLAGQEEGQTIVEYALIIAVFSIVMIASLGLFEGGLTAYMQNIVDNLSAVF
jgi:Flp pilus assembly pilin Flp